MAPAARLALPPYPRLQNGPVRPSELDPEVGGRDANEFARPSSTKRR